MRVAACSKPQRICFPRSSVTSPKSEELRPPRQWPSLRPQPQNPISGQALPLERKWTRSLLTNGQPGRRGFVECALKNLPSQEESRTLFGAGNLLNQSHSHKDERACLSEDGESLKTGKWGIASPEVFYGADSFDHSSASISSPGANQIAKSHPSQSQCAKPRIGSDVGSESAPVKILSKDSQASEPLHSSEWVKADPQEFKEQLPREPLDDSLARFIMLDMMRLRPELCKFLRNAFHSPAFRRDRPSQEGKLSRNFFETYDEGDLQWCNIKCYLVARDGGLLYISVGREKLVIFQPLTWQVNVSLLNYLAHPEQMHLKMDHDCCHYRVLVSGSATIGLAQELSGKTEDLGSKNGARACPDGSDVPCPDLGLNENQRGAYCKSVHHLCELRGVRAFIILSHSAELKCAHDPHVTQLRTPLISSRPNVYHLATAQILECGDSMFEFGEQDSGRNVYSIHKLVPDAASGFILKEAVRRTWASDGRGLLVQAFFCYLAFMGQVSSAHAGVLIEETVKQSSSAADGNVSWQSRATALTLASILFGGVALKLGGGAALKRLGVAVWRWMSANSNFEVDEGLRRGPMPRRGNPDFAIHPALH